METVKTTIQLKKKNILERVTKEVDGMLRPSNSSPWRILAAEDSEVLPKADMAVKSIQTR